MINVKIRYINTILELTHPESFNECSAEQLRAAMKFIYSSYATIEDKHAAQIELLQVMLSQRLSHFIKTKWYKIMDTMVKENMLPELLKLQDFIYKDQVFNNWIMRELVVHEKIYHGPKNRFSYMTFGQFITADMLFMGYNDNKTDEALNLFIASLYTENPKEEFTTEYLSEKSEQFKTLGMVDKNAIVFNYSALRYWLTEKYTNVFNEKKDETKIVLGGNHGGWMTVRRNLAESVLNLDKIDRILMHDVLGDLNEKIIEE